MTAPAIPRAPWVRPSMWASFLLVVSFALLLFFSALYFGALAGWPSVFGTRTPLASALWRALRYGVQAGSILAWVGALFYAIRAYETPKVEGGCKPMIPRLVLAATIVSSIVMGLFWMFVEYASMVR